jgi:hypothetical protein
MCQLMAFLDEKVQGNGKPRRRTSCQQLPSIPEDE